MTAWSVVYSLVRHVNASGELARKQLTKLKVGLLQSCVVTAVHSLFTRLKLWPIVIKPQQAMNIVDTAPSALSTAAAAASPTKQQLRLMMML